MLLVGVAVLTFSSLVYFAEKDNPLGSWSFLDSFWWGLMTLTTVGYGDLSPSTFPGKLIGGLCALGGIFILTLPIPIVVNSFASYYKNRRETRSENIEGILYCYYPPYRGLGYMSVGFRGHAIIYYSSGSL